MKSKGLGKPRYIARFIQLIYVGTLAVDILEAKICFIYFRWFVQPCPSTRYDPSYQLWSAWWSRSTHGRGAGFYLKYIQLLTEQG